MTVQQGGPVEALGVLQLGHPDLWKTSAPVGGDRAAVAGDVARLESALLAFRAAVGFGRAIAAPQLAIPRRIVAFHLGGRPFVMIDPVVSPVGDETLTLWDDCMSFPDLLVRVRRHRSVSVEFFDGDGRRHSWEHLPPSLAELVQHEVDHLDGILALDRRLGGDSVVARGDYVRARPRFDALVDPAPDRTEAERYVAARIRKAAAATGVMARTGT